MKVRRKTLLDVATALTAGCALLAIGMLVHDRSSRSETPGGREDKTVSDWRSYARDGHWVGPDDARVVITVWHDYQCPVCQGYEPALRAVLAKYPEDVAVVYRNWPLRQHPLAYPAARAVECAARQDRFEPVHSALYAGWDWVFDAKNAFIEIGRRSGIPDQAAFVTCLEGLDPVPEIERDIAAVRELGGTGTPTVMINDQLLLRSRPDSTELDAWVRRLKQ